MSLEKKSLLKRKPLRRFSADVQTIHSDPTGQTTLYQSGDAYMQYLESRFGERFLEYRRLWRETAERGEPGGFPLSLDLAINSGCQLSCLMCPLPGRRSGSGQISLMAEELYRRLIDQAREHNLPALTFGLASEPLLNPEATKWITLAERAGIMDIRLGTNGLLLNGKMSAALVDSGLTRLEVSIDAAKAETYALIRGGSLDKLEKAINEFLNIRAKNASVVPLLRLSFIRLEQNKGELDEFMNRWKGLADMFSIQEPIWFPGSRLNPPDASASSLAPVCAQSWQRLGVNYNGDLWPCCSWYGEELLSLNAAETDAAMAWRSPQLEELRRKLSGPACDYPKPCLNCCV